jgi:hypothetical protein
MSTCTQLTSFKGRGAVSIALRSNTGTLGQWFPVAQARLLEIENAQEFEDQYDRCDVGGGNIIHSLTQTDYNVALTTFDYSSESLARAFYGTSSAITGASVSNEAHTITALGETIPLVNPFGTTSVSVQTAGSTALVLDTDYTYDAVHGTLTALTVLAVDDILVDYTFGDYVNMEAAVAGVKEYAVRFDGINVNDNIPRQVYLHRVVMNSSTMRSLITEETATLELSGKMLPDNTKGTGQSKYWVEKIGTVAV